MAFITREDGEHFVVPSYRDVIVAKSKRALKIEISALSNNYGAYITLQEKGAAQYEVTFASDTGYLLGESVWSYFKRPTDMIYCEAIPGIAEAILVIVKDGSVYLDGQFALESIPEELVIFLTQKVNFAIYTYGDVPICQVPEVGKFCFEESMVASFTELSEPIFATMPLLKIYQLQPIEKVMEDQGIGVLPIRQVLIVFVIIGAISLFWYYLAAAKEQVVQVVSELRINPYREYNAALQTPDPDQEISSLINLLPIFYAMPGWDIKQINYAQGKLMVGAVSNGTDLQTLMDWSERNNIVMNLDEKGVVLSTTIDVAKRPIPAKIYPIKQVITSFFDTLNLVLSHEGNQIKFTRINERSSYSTSTITISFSNLSPAAVELVGEQMKGLPMVLKSVAMTVGSDGLLAGTISLDVLGN